MFCAASLCLFGEDGDRPHVTAALRVSLQAQDPSGCWPLGRIVRANKDIEAGRIEISTYEVSWALAEVLRHMSQQAEGANELSPGPEAMAALGRATAYTNLSQSEIESGAVPRRGWCSEHAFEASTIESWTCATVLDAALSTRACMELDSRRKTLAQFTTAVPGTPGWPEWLRWSRYVTENEPHSDHPVLRYLDEHIVRAILVNPRRLPSRRDRTVSVVLFGPPGTRKTCIAKAMADGLQWPLVSLSPGTFIERGLEYIEAESRKVFDRLLQLNRAVIVFDECDELFLKRETVPEAAQRRSITAFVTGSMLPKLQELHDREQVVFVICTNRFEAVDPAVWRAGRVDHVIGIGPPDGQARTDWARREMARRLQDRGVALVPEVLQAVATSLGADEANRFVYSELDLVLRAVLEPSPPTAAAEATGRTAMALQQVGEPTVGVEEEKSFNELRASHCRVYLSG
jgi:hypothetical protein